MFDLLYLPSVLSLTLWSPVNQTAASIPATPSHSTAPLVCPDTPAHTQHHPPRDSKRAHPLGTAQIHTAHARIQCTHTHTQRTPTYRHILYIPHIPSNIDPGYCTNTYSTHMHTRVQYTHTLAGACTYRKHLHIDSRRAHPQVPHKYIQHARAHTNVYSTHTVHTYRTPTYRQQARTHAFPHLYCTHTHMQCM